MYRRVLLTLALVSGACDTPPVVSFDTPDQCRGATGTFETFTRASEACGESCTLCIESEQHDRAMTYSVYRDDECVCPPPSVTSSSDDAGTNDTGSGDVADGGADAGSARGDAGAWTESGSTTGTVDAGTVSPSDGCRSLLHLSRAEARTRCEAWDDCNVCEERVDLDGEVRSYMAHQCGCPAAYRIDP